MPFELYLDDTHGSPAHRQHLTYYFAEQIRAELSALARNRDELQNQRTVFRALSLGPANACEPSLAISDGSA